MTTNPPADPPEQTGQPGPSEDDPDSGGCGCEDCDPSLIDGFKCRAEGIAKQAEYNAVSQPELQAARIQYDVTRKAYRTQRNSVAIEVADLRHQVKHLIERVRCQIKQERVVICLDEAFETICEQLADCGCAAGCCADDDCEFDKSCPEDYRELVRRIADYQAHLDKDKACFTSLVGEPDALAARVTSAKAEVDAITAALQADPASTDLKRVYASALVAQRHLRQIWNGFDETRDFIDCLCRALTCWTKAADAVSVLTGMQAVKDCHRAAHEAHCKDLADNTVEEILIEYERVCGCDPCEDRPPRTEDCGCGCQDDDRERDHDRGRDRDRDRDRDGDRDRDHDRDRDRDRDRDGDRDRDRDRDDDRDRDRNRY